MTPVLRLLLLLPLPLLAACDATSPTPVGSISGQVVIEGQGIAGVAVALSSGPSTTTAATGAYRFDQVEGGPHTVAISGYPLDATFQATSTSVEIVSDGQTVIVDFRGEYIRTARLMGRVAVEGRTLAGVTVRLAGMSEGLTSTNEVGQFAFEDLRAGDYSVAISDFGEAEFAVTSQSASLAVGESRVLSFDGTYIRTSSISVSVSVEGEGLADVTVSLSGGPDAVSETATTDAGGYYAFSRLRAGDYSVVVSGYDTDEYNFEITSQDVPVAPGETANVAFEGFRVPPDLTGTYDLVSISSLVTGGKTLKPPDVSGTFVLLQSASVGRRVSGTMTMEITVQDGLGGTTNIKDTGTYAVRADGTWEQKGSLVQAKGTYTLVGGVLTVEVTEPAINVSTTVWQRR